MGNIIVDILWKKFDVMPRPVKILTYLLILSLFSYLLLIPSFICGNCFIEDKDGRLIPNRAGIITTNIEGKSIKVKIDEEGYWAMPVVSKLPNKIKLHFWHEDKADEILISLPALWISSTHEVHLKGNPPKFCLVSLAIQIAPKITHALALIKCLWGPQLAYGQDEITGKVYAAIINLGGGTQPHLSPSVQLKSDLHFDRLKLIKLVMSLEREFNIKIRDEDWEKWVTVQDIIDYLKKRVHP